MTWQQQYFIYFIGVQPATEQGIPSVSACHRDMGILRSIYSRAVKYARRLFIWQAFFLAIPLLPVVGLYETAEGSTRK